ncbi:hypothetical protein CGCSCA5_v014898 [Colletotrichum siamense]|nr:hypothetical protein CGCSCA5_v014898 [Colletotrichum siamense]
MVRHITACDSCDDDFVFISYRDHENSFRQKFQCPGTSNYAYPSLDPDKSDFNNHQYNSAEGNTVSPFARAIQLSKALNKNSITALAHPALTVTQFLQVVSSMACKMRYGNKDKDIFDDDETDYDSIFEPDPLVRGHSGLRGLYLRQRKPLDPACDNGDVTGPMVTPQTPTQSKFKQTMRKMKDFGLRRSQY